MDDSHMESQDVSMEEGVRISNEENVCEDVSTTEGEVEFISAPSGSSTTTSAANKGKII